MPDSIGPGTACQFAEDSERLIGTGRGAVMIYHSQPGGEPAAVKQTVRSRIMGAFRLPRQQHGGDGSHGAVQGKGPGS